MSIDEKIQSTEWTAGPLTAAALTGKARIGDSALAQRLNRELEGDVLFDRFSRGRYATDASIYQMEPMGVIVPRTARDVSRAMAIAADEGIPITARGGGTATASAAAGASPSAPSRHANQVKLFGVYSQPTHGQEEEARGERRHAAAAHGGGALHAFRDFA